jgi:hypothetical protein
LIGVQWVVYAEHDAEPQRSLLRQVLAFVLQNLRDIQNSKISGSSPSNWKKVPPNSLKDNSEKTSKPLPAVYKDITNKASFRSCSVKPSLIFVLKTV